MTLAIRENCSLASYTTLKTGGVATYVITVKTEDDVTAAVTFATAQGLPFLVLGGGSNVLVSDEGFHGVVIHMAISGRSYDRDDESGDVYARYGAGEVLDEVVAETVALGYWGLENLSHIPGTVGATPIQNVGAYGIEVGELISQVTVYDTETHTTAKLENDVCLFSYRDSIFKQHPRKYIVLSVTFRLSLSANPRIAYSDLQARLTEGLITQTRIRETIIDVRSHKFPDWHTVGTAGSFFKNPIISAAAHAALITQYPLVPSYDAPQGMKKVSLGYILDKVCGLKGYRRGNVRLFEGQALVLVAERGATTTEILAFARYVSDAVKEKTKIEIETEVTKIL